VGILNLIRAFLGIPHHRFNLFVKCSSAPVAIVAVISTFLRVNPSALLGSSIFSLIVSMRQPRYDDALRSGQACRLR
jgi:hypothetical protein